MILFFDWGNFEIPNIKGDFSTATKHRKDPPFLMWQPQSHRVYVTFNNVYESLVCLKVFSYQTEKENKKSKFISDEGGVCFWFLIFSSSGPQGGK